MRAATSILATVVLVGGLTTPAVAADADPVRLDVGLAAGADPHEVVATLGGRVVATHAVPGLDAITVDVAADQADAAVDQLRAATGVRYAERGARVGADTVDHVEYGLVRMEIPQAWTWTFGGAGVTVAVVDTGVSPNADLGADRLAPGYDFVDMDNDPVDRDGHGTMVANVIGADPTNGVGFAGVCGRCRVMPVRAVSGREGTSADVAAGIAWAADHGAQVINVSLSAPAESHLLSDAVEHAAGKGSLVVASAGNEDSTARRYPAAFGPVLAVGEDGTAAKNTAADQWVDVTAPSGYQPLGRNGGPSLIRGASGATAAAAGVAALAFAMKPTASADEVRQVIQRDAERPRQYGYDAPMINAAHVVYDLGGTDTVAPTVTRTGLAENEFVPIRGVGVIPAATDDHGVERLEVLVDGHPPRVVPHPGTQITIPPPPGRSGPFSVTVRAYDYAGNVGEQTTIARADTVAPSGTIVSPPLGTVVHDPTIDVTVESPDNDLQYVGTYSDGGAFTRVAGTNRWQARIPVDPHTGEIRLLLEDNAGNRTNLTRQVAFDNDPPAGGTVTPAAGATVHGTFTSTLTGVTDASGMVKAELWANGTYVGNLTSAPYAPYALDVRTGSYSGNLNLTWRVTDGFGQSRTLAGQTVVADNTGPSVSITKAPKNKAKVKGTVTVTAKASDPSGVARVELLVNGKVVVKDTTSGYVLRLNTAKVARTMKVQVRAYDKLGNVKSTGTLTWYRK
ncbi:S8 family serine peptidase [Krasilnikovia sp. MM14-A1259]|uniref:S8 family serine peptidase n=1 Tax=Krasilnikovia sp. MM14-A1259 TaxID=3373539 RepID=UPI0038043B32